MRKKRTPDISPIDLTEVDWGVTKLRCREPLCFTVTYEIENDILTIEEPKLGVNTFAFSRCVLAQQLNEQLVMLWREYALAEDDTLSKPAQKLKARLLAAFDDGRREDR